MMMNRIINFQGCGDDFSIIIHSFIPIQMLCEMSLQYYLKLSKPQLNGSDVCRSDCHYETYCPSQVIIIFEAGNCSREYSQSTVP